MKILDVKIRWNPSYANPPEFLILVDDLPLRRDKRWVVREGLYYCEQGDLVDYLYYTSPGEGFAGRRFDIKMLDGTGKTLHGPWSSRAGVANARCMSEFYNSSLKEPNKAYPCSEVLLATNPEKFKKGYTMWARNFRLPALLEAAKLAGVHLLVRWTGDKYGPDTSDEQTNVVRLLEDKEQHAAWENWTEIPAGIEFNFCPSLLPDRLKKADDETYRDTIAYFL